MTKCLNCGHTSDEDFRFCPECGTKSEGDKAESLITKTLSGKYIVLEKIGAGAMGTVYRGEHISLRKPIALKVLHPDLYVSEESMKRFQAEGIAAGKFSHPNAIQIFDFDKEGGQLLYLAMEYVEGQNITQYLGEHGPVAPAVAVDVLLQVLGALSEAHRHGIVHRDLKPDNVMLVKSSSGGLDVKVLDFGLSKLVDLPSGSSMQTQAGRILGTPRYMAPEQWGGKEVDHRLDIWAAGLVLYELLTGEAPYAADTIQETLLRTTTDDVPVLSQTRTDLSVPPALDEVIAKALEKDRDDRYQSADEMIAALEDVPLGPAQAANVSTTRSRSMARRRPQTVAKTAAPRPRSRAMWVAAGVVAMLLIGLAVWQFGFGGGSQYPRVRLKPSAQRSALEIVYLERIDDARASLAAGNTDAAFATIDKARGMECRDAEAFVVRAGVYRARGDDDSALADLAEASRRDPSYGEPISKAGWILLDRDKLDEALGKFEQALGLDETSADAHAGKGSVFLKRGDYESAVQLLRKAIELDRTAALSHWRLGQALLAQGSVDEATNSFVDAKRNAPKFAPAYVGLGEAYIAQNELEQAERELREADRIATSPETRALLATVLLERGRPDEANKLATETLDDHPDHARLFVVAGLARKAVGDDSGAIQALEKGLSIDANDAAAQALLGVLYQRAGRNEDAVKCCREALSRDGDLVSAWVTLGIAQFRLEEFQEAAKSLREATKRDESNAFAFYSLGVICMDYLEDADEARKCFERCQELGSKNPNLERLLLRVGK